MKSAMSSAVARLVESPGPVPLVAFVGPVNRTWFVDIDWIYLVMEVLRESRMYQPVRGGLYGFDLWVGRCAQHVGLVDVVATTTDPADQLSKEYHRPVDMLEGVCMVVAFPLEEPPKSEESKGKNTKTHPPESADLAIVNAAGSLKIPVLVVRRSGQTEWRPQ